MGRFQSESPHFFLKIQRSFKPFIISCVNSYNDLHILTHMKKLLLLTVFAFLSFPFYGATITGKIIDADSGSPLDFVNVTLFSPPSKQPAGGATTNNGGTFKIESLSKGKYFLMVTFVGYNPYRKPVELTSDNLDLGEIKLATNSKTLKEVEVVGQGPQMRIEADKKVFTVDQNISAAGGSISDALKNIPSVNVDNDGNISLRNDANVEVWINGKPSGLTADNRAQILQQMPAESVESVEVMTNPSAKMSAEGSAGVINLVMKQNRKAGYNGSISGGLSYPHASFFNSDKLSGNTGANFSFNSGKIEANATIGYRKMNMIGGGITSRTTNLKGDTIQDLTRQNTIENHFGGLFVRANIDYHITKRNTISLSGFGINGGGNSNNTTDVNDNKMLNGSVIKPNNYIEQTLGSGRRPSINGNIDFKHDFEKKGSSLAIGLAYSTHNFNFENEAISHPVDSLIRTRDITQGSISAISQSIGKIDYVNKIDDSNKLEAGWQSSLSNRLSTATAFDNLSKTDINSYYNKFDYDEEIHAAYLNYSTKLFEKLSAQVGLRGEYLNKSISNTIRNTVGNEVVTTLHPKDRLDLFPSAFLSYSLPNNNEIQINYSRRVNRPRGRQINPFHDYSNTSVISFGNPNLDPELMSALELNYIKTWDTNTLSVSAFYRFTDNSIQSVQYLDTLTKKMNSTFTNISKVEKAGLELISKNQLLRFLNFTTSVSMYYSHLYASTYTNPLNPSDIVTMNAKEGMCWNASELLNFMLSKTFSGQITAKYYGPQVINQGTQREMYSIDLGFRQMFFDRKLILALTVNDLLNSMRNASFTSDTNWSQTSSSFMNGRTIGFMLTYNFGNTKPKKEDMMKRKQQMEQGGQDMNFGGE
jgi:iron complex outermembrane recepter protein